MPKKVAKKRPNYTKNQWFYTVRGSFLPRTWQAWALYVPYTAVLLGSVAWAHQHNASTLDVVFRAFPVWVAAAVVMTWIAKARS